MGNIEADTEVAEGVECLSLHGEHDLDTAGDLRGRIETALDAGRAVIVDLTAAEFVDSAILAVLVDCAKPTEEGPGRFAVCLAEGGSRSVERVLGLTGLKENLPVHASRGDAAASLDHGAAGEAA